MLYDNFKNNKKNFFKIDSEYINNNSSMDAITEIKNNIEMNNNTIKELEESNKCLVEKLKRYERIENYDIDKLDNLHHKLKDMLNIQNDYNKFISDRHKPITKKYLPFNYDINEIIRKKIVDDSKIKFEVDILTWYFELREILIKERLLSRISWTLNRLYNDENYGPLATIQDFIVDLNEIYEEAFKADELPSENNNIRWRLMSGDYTVEQTIKKYIKNHPKIVEKYKDRVYGFIDLKENFIDLLNGANIENNKVYSFTLWYNNETIKIRNKDTNRRNGNGYSKLKKIILEWFKMFCPKIVENINENNVKTEWTNKCEWFGCGEELDTYNRREKLLAMIYKTPYPSPPELISPN
tara:strand:- start:1560 stop:2621 length:1062 start_codon:yes stop_codon:yes gene_type:complete